jgi:hypothetical protein
MPPIEDETARWSASAPVPPRGPAPSPVYDEEPLYDEAGPRGERSWLTPVIVGVVAVVLLALLATGLWLIFNAEQQSGPGPSASPPAEPAPTTAAPVSSAARPTTAPPSTAPPTAAPPPSVPPQGVVVPRLIGLSEAEARQRLADAGLRADVVRQPVPGVAPGTVVLSQPVEGTQVEPNSVVRLVVAAGALSPPRSSAAG